MKVLYVSSKRSEERVLLSCISGLEFEEINLHIKSSSYMDIIRRIITIRSRIKHFSPDIMLFESAALYSIIPALMAKLYNIPYAVRFKGDVWNEYSQIKHDISLFNKAARFVNYSTGIWVLKHASIILPNADHFCSLIERNLRVKKLIHTVRYTPNYDILKRNNGMSCLIDERYVLTVTNFNFWEKVSPLISAIKNISHCVKNNGFSWFVLGEGCFLEKLRAAVKDEIESGSVKLLGWQDPNQYYRSASSLFYLSLADGLPNVLLEASIHRLPIVMNKECPAIDFIEDGYNGIVLDFDNLKLVEEVIERLVIDDEWIKSLGNNAYEHVKENYSIEKVSDELRIALDKIVPNIW